MVGCSIFLHNLPCSGQLFVRNKVLTGINIVVHLTAEAFKTAADKIHLLKKLLINLTYGAEIIDSVLW
jgi:hypothetical protein